jgi:hypothetical protein
MDEWAPFRRLGDLPSAEALVELLLARKVPARLDAPHLLPGIDGYVVSVPSDLLHRAAWVAPEAPFDEAELAFLATGRLDTE